MEHVLTVKSVLISQSVLIQRGVQYVTIQPNRTLWTYGKVFNQVQSVLTLEPVCSKCSN